MEDKFKAIKDYKALLDADIITIEEFNSKKIELFFNIESSDSFNNCNEIKSDKFELIKQYKIKLDSGEISKTDFIEKKESLFFSDVSDSKQSTDNNDKATDEIQAYEDESLTTQLVKEQLAPNVSEGKTQKKKKYAVIIPVTIIILTAAVLLVLYITGIIGSGGSHVKQIVSNLEAGQEYALYDLFEPEEGYQIQLASEDENSEADLFDMFNIFNQGIVFYTGEANSDGIKIYSNDELTKTLTLSVTSESGKISTEEFTFFISDTTAPVIYETDRYMLQLGEDINISELFSVWDSSIKNLTSPLSEKDFEQFLNGKVTIDSTALNLSSVGEYPVKISASDSSGNTSEKEILIIVIDNGTSVSLNADTQYELNIFLSNFAEQGIFFIDANSSDSATYIDFVLRYLFINENSNISFKDIYAFTSLNVFQEKMNRFFGKELSSEELQSISAPTFSYSGNGPFYDGSNVYEYAESMALSANNVAVVDSILNFADGHQEVEFSVYGVYGEDASQLYNDDNFSLKTDAYRISSEEAASTPGYNYWGSGTAVVVPKDVDGRHTYELISYNFSY